jgi:hypothetical protein
MRKKKIIDTEFITQNLTNTDLATKGLYLELITATNDGGIVQNDEYYYCPELTKLKEMGLVSITETSIVVNGFIQSNYGNELKPTYNPHKPILQSIEDSGFAYNPTTNEIEVPESDKISPNYSLKELEGLKSGISGHGYDKSAVTTPEISQKNIIGIITSMKFALYVSLLLILVQSVHTSFTIMDLSHIPDPYNTITSIFTALMMDSLIIYFVAHGKTVQSGVFFVWCSAMNIYSLHLGTEFWTYKSWFAMIVAIGIPYAVHSVSKRSINTERL